MCAFLLTTIFPQMFCLAFLAFFQEHRFPVDPIIGSIHIGFLVSFARPRATKCGVFVTRISLGSNDFGPNIDRFYVLAMRRTMKLADYFVYGSWPVANSSRHGTTKVDGHRHPLVVSSGSAKGMCSPWSKG